MARLQVETKAVKDYHRSISSQVKCSYIRS